jgi:hypothetical protein
MNTRQKYNYHLPSSNLSLYKKEVYFKNKLKTQNGLRQVTYDYVILLARKKNIHTKNKHSISTPHKEF